MEYESIGKTIQTLRKKKGMTQRELAEQLNVTDKAVSKWERDIARPEIDILPQLAKVLDTTVALLLNAQEETSENETDRAPTATQPDEEIHVDKDLNPLWEHYRERVRALLRQGIIGFAIGSVGLLIIFLTTSLNAKTFNIWEIPGILLFAIICGLFFAGMPYGWQVISKWTNQWIIYGNILVVLFLFVLKIIGTFTIAMVGYPIALIYNFIRSQKSKKKVKTAFLFWLYVVFAIIMATHQ